MTGKISLLDQLLSVKREIRIRRANYPKWVASGRLKAEIADTEIARMQAVQHTLEVLLSAAEL